MKPFIPFLLALTIAYFAKAQTLAPGMDAPAIEVGEWLKGREVQKFEKDSTYVVEFWATWCGPCKQSIPHLTELAAKYPAVNIIGVSIAEANTAKVAPYVQQMGDKMNYTVAIDKQESPTARQGYMSKNWLEAAGLKGIPAAFVVYKNEIAWIGYPLQLDSVLESISTGKWNTRAFAKKWKKEKEEEKVFNSRMQAFDEKMKAHAKDNQKKQLYKTFDDFLHFIIENPEKAGWPVVNELMWNWIADPNGKQLPAELKDYSFGIRWMEELAARPEGKNPAFFDTLAWCYFGAGNNGKAAELEAAALNMLPANATGRSDYEMALKTFRGE